MPSRLGEMKIIQRQAALRCVVTYNMVSYEATNLLAGMPPMELLIEERAQMYWQNKKDRNCSTEKTENESTNRNKEEDD